ncbi:MAG: AraC family transcriptional regulator [Pseudomonadota bacterium]
MHAWLLIGILQPLFVAAMFATRGRRGAASLWLFSWLALVMVHQGAIYLSYAHPGAVPLFLGVGLGLLPLVHGPFAWGYVASLTPPHAATRLPWLHFAPFFVLWAALGAIAVFGYGGFSIETPFGVTIIRNASGEQLQWLGWLFAISGGVYPLASLYFLRTQRLRLRQTRSNVNAVDFHWLEIWVFGHLVAFAVIFTAQTVTTIEFAMPFASWAMAAEVFYLGIFGVWHFDRSGSEPKKQDAPASPAATLQEDTDRLLAHMEKDAPYLNAGLTLSALSESSGLAETTITGAVKHAGYKHFFDFVNAHRCEAVKARLAAPENNGLTLLDIALAAGFNSKSSFNRVFKSYAGMSPSAFREKSRKTP